MAADAIDIDDAVGNAEAAWMVGVERCLQVAAFDECDTVAVVTHLIAAWLLVVDAFELCCSGRKGMTDEQVGLHEQQGRVVERGSADVKPALAQDVRQFLDGEDAFDVVDGIENGKALACLSQVVGLKELLEAEV